jgi:hypothetical protein
MAMPPSVAVAIEAGSGAGFGCRLTGFEDSNSSANVDIGSIAAGHGIVLSTMGDNPALLNNGSNGDSVPAVPGTRPHVSAATTDLGPSWWLVQGDRGSRVTSDRRPRQHVAASS